MTADFGFQGEFPRCNSGAEEGWPRDEPHWGWHSRLSNDWAHRYRQMVDYREVAFQNHKTG